MRGKRVGETNRWRTESLCEARPWCKVAEKEIVREGVECKSIVLQRFYRKQLTWISLSISRICFRYFWFTCLADLSSDSYRDVAEVRRVAKGGLIVVRSRFSIVPFGFRFSSINCIIHTSRTSNKSLSSPWRQHTLTFIHMPNRYTHSRCYYHSCSCYHYKSTKNRNSHILWLWTHLW